MSPTTSRRRATAAEGLREDGDPINIVSEIYRGELDVDKDARINGMVTGNVTVLNGHVVIGGTVGGQLAARGGTVTVCGSVGGPLQGDPTAIRVAEGAVVKDLSWPRHGDRVRELRDGQSDGAEAFRGDLMQTQADARRSPY